MDPAIDAGARQVLAVCTERDGPYVSWLMLICSFVSIQSPLSHQTSMLHR